MSDLALAVFSSLRTSAFLALVAIAIIARQFLRFAFEGRAYQFRVLPFGMSLAPRVFTWFAAAALSPLQGRGMRIFPYLDDWLVCARSRVDALSDLSLLIEHLRGPSPC